VPRSFSVGVEKVGEALHKQAGSYLQSTVRRASVTCSVCSTPTGGLSSVCTQCLAHRRLGIPLADRVASLVYAPYRTQTYQLVSQYKTDRPGPAITSTMTALLAVGLRGHYGCAVRLANCGADYWGVVPSTRGRSTLSDIVGSLAKSTAHRVSIEYRGPAGHRSLDPSLWSTSTVVPADAHVLLVDDSWVSGARAQSVASAMKRAGFRQVSVLTAARVMNPEFGPNGDFIDKSLGGYNWRRCPWTGGACPN
jgi:hypothetical protein